jgi:hypothetical protein
VAPQINVGSPEERLEKLLTDLALVTSLEIVTVREDEAVRQEYAKNAGEYFLDSGVSSEMLWELPTKIVIAMAGVIVEEGKGDSEFGTALVHDLKGTTQALVLTVRYPDLCAALWDKADTLWDPENPSAFWAVAKLLRDLGERDPGLNLSRPGILAMTSERWSEPFSPGGRCMVVRHELFKMLDTLEGRPKAPRKNGDLFAELARRQSAHVAGPDGAGKV